MIYARCYSQKFKAEANKDTGLKAANWMRPYMTCVIPVIIAFIFIYGIYKFFK